MNPNSQYYLAFNLGYPNAYDRALERTGDALMVHGKCKSAGCYAMTDALMEEIYALARESLKRRPGSVRGARLPLPHDGSESRALPGQPEHAVLADAEAGLRLLREVSPAARRRRVREALRRQREDPSNASIRPDGRCPRFQRPVFEPFSPKPFEEQIADERITAPGPKTRQFADVIVKPPQDAIAAATNADQPAYGLVGLGAPVETGSTPAPALGFSQ